jgi:hypothetical protein
MRMSVLSHPVLSRTKPCSQAQGRGSDLQSDTNSLAGDLSILDAAELDIRNYEVHTRDARLPPKQFASTRRGSAYESGHGITSTLISRTRSADAGISSQPTSRMVNSADQSKRPLPAQKPQLSSLARSFVSLGLGEYSKSSHFISDNQGNVLRPASSRHDPNHAPEPNRHNSAENDIPASFKRLSIGDGKPKLGLVTEHPGLDFQSDTNSHAGDISILDAAEPGIRGNGGDHEELDHRYHRGPEGKKFFMVGRVFAMLWHEGAGDGKGGHLSQAEPFNVQKNSTKDLCPEDRQAHSVIYMDDTKHAIHPTENGMMFKPGDFGQRWWTTSLRPVALVGLGGVG